MGDDPGAMELIALGILGLAGTVARASGGREAIDAARRELPDFVAEVRRASSGRELVA